MDSRCFPGWWEQEGMAAVFWGDREVEEHLLHSPGYSSTLGAGFLCSSPC